MVKFPLRRVKNSELAAAVWTRCAPFVLNERAVLVHRPREVTTYNLHKQPHLAVHYWCGGAATGGIKFTFLSSPPENRLLCERCEVLAVAAKLPSADTLSGRHVHVGKVKALQTCCNKDAK